MRTYLARKGSCRTRPLTWGPGACRALRHIRPQRPATERGAVCDAEQTTSTRVLNKHAGAGRAQSRGEGRRPGPSTGSHLLLGQSDKPEDALQVWPVDEGAHPGILQKGVPEFYPLSLFHHFRGKPVENFLLHEHPRAVAANLGDKHTPVGVARRRKSGNARASASPRAGPETKARSASLCLLNELTVTDPCDLRGSVSSRQLLRCAACFRGRGNSGNGLGENSEELGARA